jgi:acetyl esterase/lipase
LRSFGIIGVLGLPGVVVAWILSTPSLAETAFYEATAAELAGEPGSIIRFEELPVYPIGSRGYRILYRSIGLKGEPIAVSAAIAVPHAHGSNRPVVAWAHPTTGVARRCAPSLHGAVLKTVPGIDEMIKRGFVVVATDYPGLGTAGHHPYLVGISEGRAVLDSVRAARAFEKAAAGDSFAAWGHSQGGHAALFAGQLAKSYAGELKLVGIATAAPASELGKLFEADEKTTAGHGLTALTLVAWSRLYDISLDGVVAAGKTSYVEKIGAECITSTVDLIADLEAANHLKTKFLIADPVTTPPWDKITAENVPGQAPPGGPIFIAQGTFDEVVDPSVTENFADRLCKKGAAVRYFSVPGASHETIAQVSAWAAVAWIADRFAGAPAPTSCR